MNRFQLVSLPAVILFFVSPVPAQVAVPKDKPGAVANDSIVGDWQVVRHEYNGDQRDTRGYLWHIQATAIAHTVGGVLDRKPNPWTYKVDDTKKPKEIDIREIAVGSVDRKPREEIMRGIYKVEGKMLSICFKVTGNERPAEFVSAKDSKTALLVMQRVARLKPNPPAEDVLGKALAEIEEKAKQGAALVPVPPGMGDDKSELTIIYNRGRALMLQGRIDAAIPEYEKAIPLAVRVFGPDDVNTAIFVDQLGQLYRAVGQYDKAELLLQRALNIVEKRLGKKDLHYADILYHLAALYHVQGMLTQAELLYRQTFEIRNPAIAEQRPKYLENLHNLAVVNFQMGDYRKAELYLREELELLKKVPGERHPAYLSALDNMGLLYYEQGDFARAEPLFRQACEISRQVLGDKHRGYAGCLGNLARLYRDQGDYARAEPLMRQALEIRLRAPEEKQEQIANSLRGMPQGYPNQRAIAQNLDDLAELYCDQRDFARAEPLYRQALEIRKRYQAVTHTDYCASLNSLGRVYSDQGEYSRAEPLLHQAVENHKQAQREKHPAYAASLSVLARWHHEQGNYTSAEPLYRQALDIRKVVPGEKHPHYAGTLESLASLYQATNRSADAWRLATRSMEIRQANLRSLFSFSSEATMRAHVENTRASLPLFLSHGPNEQLPRETWTPTAFTWVLRRKGVLLDAVCRFRQYERELEHNPALAQKAARWRYLRQQLADLPLKESTRPDPQAVEKEIQSWRNEADQLEADLHRALSEQMKGAVNDVDVQQVQRQLPLGAALVEFVRVDLYDFKATGKQPRWKPPHYFAFILTDAKDTAPQMIDLGPAEPIDQAVRKLRQQVEAAPASLRFSSEKDVEGEFRTASRTFCKSVFAPLQTALANSTVIYLAPDGELNRLAFEALVDDQDRYLIERYRFVYLSCGRDLVRPNPKPASGTVVFAGPDFDLNSKDRKDQVMALLPKPDQVALRGPTTADLRGLRWSALPGAGAEAADIEKALQNGSYGPVSTYSGAKALEDVFKRMKAPRVLHLATHGFFLEDVQRRPEQTNDILSRTGDTRGQERLRMSKNPLLRSGIVLAGANALGEATTLTDVDDGWVTAEEIALLNLQGTDLVVLSACESGLGDLKTGEGIYGLRRAFLYAGARTLVTSLFKVPDKETREMMQRFYGSLQAGKGKLESLHDAQLTVIQRRRKEHGAAHPFFWASFVVVGEPGSSPGEFAARSESPNQLEGAGQEITYPPKGTSNAWPWLLGGSVGLLLIVGLVGLVWLRARIAAGAHRHPQQ